MTKQLQKKLIQKHFVVAFTALLFFCTSVDLFAQVRVGASIEIRNADFYVQSGEVSWTDVNTTAQIVTKRGSVVYNSNEGAVMLGSNASFNTTGTGTINTTPYVRSAAGTYSTNETLLAIGHGSLVNPHYAPVMVHAPANTIGVRVRAVQASVATNIGATKDESVSQVVSNEYWHINGEDAKISLSWRSNSGLSAFAYADVTIVGYRNGKWEAIDSAIDAVSKFGGTSTLSGTGSITSTGTVDVSLYSAFTIGEKGVTCFAAVTPSGTTRTWNGTWDVTPTINDAVTLSANYSGPAFQCYSLSLGANNVTINGGTLEVVGDITGTGKVFLDGDEGLVQHLSGAAKPQIELTRTTRAIKRFDYVYWGAPVVENVFSQLDNNAVASGQMTSGAFDSKFKYVAGVTGSTGGWQNLTSTTPGEGFIMRVKEQAPFVDASTSQTINMKFTGTANNGDVPLNIAISGTPDSARNNNLLANPYPSAIDAEKFLTENNNLVDGVIYLWQAATNNSGANGEAYTNADYIAYTKAGSQAYSGIGTGTVFNGKIASGQGFKVRALTAGTGKFTNCMRIIDNNSQFLRTNANSYNSESVTDRFRLSLSTGNGVANQILIAYTPETTLGYDNMYDARMLTTTETSLYSVLDNDSQKLAINARPSFQNTDQVTLGFSKSETITTPMYINIVNREGIFENNQTPIYLFDADLNTYHNFANGAYAFTTTANQNDARFKIVYQSALLNNDDFSTAIIAAYIKNNEFNLLSSKDVATIQIFDLTGRLVANYNANNQKNTKEVFDFASAIYVAKITFTDGNVTSQKLINQ